MQIHSDKSKLRALLKAVKLEGKTIGLVPTMGNLHGGHMQLIKEAREKTDFLVCTIFVNPLQFGANEDLDSYPRTLEADAEKLETEHCDCLFAPQENEIYGTDLDAQTIIKVPGLTENFCGQSRPGHFDGVATVVSKLFNIVQPNIAFFGLKDYQQFLVIQKFTADLGLDIELVGVETQREESGLALSSRNNYLSDEQKQSAASIYQCLTHCREQIKQGNRDFPGLEKAAQLTLQQQGLKPDYFSICNAKNLHSASTKDKDLVILAAAYIGQSRLIDNIRLQLAS